MAPTPLRCDLPIDLRGPASADLQSIRPARPPCDSQYAGSLTQAMYVEYLNLCIKITGVMSILMLFFLSPLTHMFGQGGCPCSAPGVGCV